MIRKRYKFLAGLLLGIAALGAQADTYPSRPIKVVSPFPAGGATDLGQVLRSGAIWSLGGDPGPFFPFAGGQNRKYNPDYFQPRAGDDGDRAARRIGDGGSTMVGDGIHLFLPSGGQ